MCLHKRVLRNRVAPYKQSQFDKFTISVQCNHCPECRKQRQNDWLVRSYFEFTGRSYRSSFFVTLDFDDEHLPRYNGVACFDSELVKSFLKRLRYYVPVFRYMYSTDYGAALERPHYHFMFFFNDHIDKVKFFQCINKCWTYGQYENIQQLKSGSSFWDCVNYVCKYTTKDITFSLDKDLPCRYSSRVRASKGFGLSALEDGKITFDMLRDDSPLMLPVGSGGKLIKFKIPRYYELKFTHYSVYYPEFRRSEWFRTEEGEVLQELRHNRHYDYYYNLLRLSVSQPLHTYDCFHKFVSRFPSSPYVNYTWKDILNDCLSDRESFENYLQIKDFLARSKDGRVKLVEGKCIDFRHYYQDDWLDYLLAIPNLDRYEEATYIFNEYCRELDYTKFLTKSFDAVIQSRKRTYNSIINNPRKFKYLKRVNYDFSKLFDTDVLQFTRSFSDYVERLDSSMRICESPDSIRKFADFRLRKYIV